MTQGAYGLSANPLVCQALIQSIVQGILIPMLTTFLTTKSDRQHWFKIYVVSINVLTLTQTIIHIIQAFDILNGIPERTILLAMAPVLTGLICAAVQAFFIYRCWRIYRQRVLAIIPLLLLWLIAVVSNVIMGVFSGKPVQNKPFNGRPGTNIPVMVWIWLISSLLFDSITTSSTIIYIYRAGKGSDGTRRILVVVWNVIWASATPPFVLTLIAVIQDLPLVVRTLTTAMIAKVFVLSLMINLVGQGYIRRLFDRPCPSPPANLQSSQSQTSRADEWAVRMTTVHTVDVELQPRSRPEAIGFSAKSPSIVKQEDDLGHTVHSIDLTWKQAS